MTAKRIHCSARLLVGNRIVRAIAQSISGKWLHVDCSEHLKARQHCEIIIMPRLSLGMDKPVKAHCVVRSVVLTSEGYRLVLEAKEFLNDGWMCLNYDDKNNGMRQ